MHIVQVNSCVPGHLDDDDVHGDGVPYGRDAGAAVGDRAGPVTEKTTQTALNSALCRLRQRSGQMFSPLSVSRLLPADYHFDMVIFDEASQVRPSDAVNRILSTLRPATDAELAGLLDQPIRR
ncbi:hypothetical protein GCM10010271_00520 [Streptomyces kurssanovii]|nr:hypothetical protein GCM10010271_00520 [Streptomyces kurssanovii]